MSQNPFFTQLRQEFQNGPYRDRFLAELQDHAEDLAEDENLPLKSLNLNFMQKHFGEPKQVKKDFINITRPWQKVLESVEALSIGFLSLFTMLFATSFLGIGSSPDPSQVLFSLSACIGILIFAYVFHRLARYFSSNQRETLPLSFWMLLIFLPHLLMTSGFILMAVYLGESSLFILAHLLWIGSGALAWKWPKKPFLKSGERKIFSRGMILKFTFLIYILSLSFLRLVDPSFQGNFLKAFFAPILAPETLFLAYFFNLTFWQPYLWVILILLLVAMGLVFLLRRKTFPWGFCAVSIYLFGILLSPPYFSWMPEFKVQAYPLTETLEQSQFGPFYKVVRHLNEDVKAKFTYQAIFHSGALLIQQNSKTVSRAWEIPFEKIKIPIVQWIDTRKKIQAQQSIFYEDAQSTSTQLECYFPKNLISLEPQEPVISSQLKSGSFCEGIYWKGVPIYLNENNAFLVQSASISEDQDWLILNLGSAVYLLDLREINLNE